MRGLFFNKVPRPLWSDKGGKPLGIGLRVRQKSARSRKGERAEGAYFMLLPDLFFALGGGHWGLCDEEGIGVHGEDANSDGESDLLRRRVGSCHNF